MFHKPLEAASLHLQVLLVLQGPATIGNSPIPQEGGMESQQIRNRPISARAQRCFDGLQEIRVQSYKELAGCLPHAGRRVLQTLEFLKGKECR
jgi:hypothetical protein